MATALSLLLACSGDDSGSTTFTGTGTTSAGTTTADPTTGESTTTDATTTSGTTSGSMTESTTVDPPIGECGDGVLDAGEECDEGDANADDAACTSACKSAACGDGLVQQGVEACDDGPQNADTAACTSACQAATCGDGLLHEGVEGCDDGNDNDDDECSNACVPATCGDGDVQDNEQCDDGNDDNTDACTNMCTDATCGDGAVYAGQEECDDGPQNADTAACTSACKDAVCGDGLLHEGVEACDDGPQNADTAACTAACKDAVCGDGLVHQGVEECDDGNQVDNDACTNACKLSAQKSCKAWLAAVPNANSGLFTIDPDGPGPQQPFQAYCDMKTDGGGWTLILNRNVNSDNNGQPDINNASGAFDNSRATNWNFDVDLFWTDAVEFAFANKQNNDCGGCEIGGYDSALRVTKPNIGSYSPTCGGVSAPLDVKKLVGPSAGNTGTGYQCASSLGWGSCAGKVCHYGAHNSNTSSDGSWSQNTWNELHFPSSSSGYRAYGNYLNEGTAWCRSCGGGLPGILNQSSTCCNVANQNNAKARWTIWAR